MLRRLLAVWLLSAAAGADTLHYLYIEPSEGVASGGHVALRLEDEVFHYQYEDGFVLLYRQPWRNFRFDYQFLQNRSLHEVALPVPASVYQAVQAAFDERLWQQQRLFDDWRAMQADLALVAGLQAAVDGESGAAELTLPVAGLFAAADADTAAEAAGPCRTAAAAGTVLSRLGASLEAAHGAGFLAQRQAGLAQALRDWRPPLPAAAAGERNYADLLAARLALQVLAAGRPLAADACHAPVAEAWRLTAGQLASLAAYQRRLLQNAVRLADSARPDWGGALLLAMARLVVLEQSIASGGWVFLDDIGPDGVVLDAADQREFAAALEPLRQAAAADWERRLAALDAAELDEAGYSGLEMAANRYLQWSGRRQTLRYHGERPLPARPAPVVAVPLPVLPAAVWRQARAALEQAAADRLQSLRDQYGYRLLTRNCVTEIFRGVDAALAAAGRDTPAAALAGGEDFVPYLSFRRVAAAVDAGQLTIWPSYRRQRLAALAAEADDGLLLGLRESNVLTGTLYRFNPDDAWFVFFSEDSVWPRPVYGAVNAAAGLAQTLAGLLWAPVDAGRMLQTGARGFAVSLPELGFVNIRKGSYRFLPETLVAE